MPKNWPFMSRMIAAKQDVELMGHLIRAHALQGYAELVRKLGGEPLELLKRFKIPPALLQEEDSFLPFRTLNSLLETSASELNCPDFGLQLSGRQGLEILGPIAVIARNVGSIRQAFQAIARYLHVHSPALRLSLGQADGAVMPLTYEIVEPRLPQLRQFNEQSMGVARQILRLLGGPAARPVTMMFTHAPLLPAKVYRDFFGCKVLFGQPHTGFLVSVDLLTRPIATADAATHRLAEQYMAACKSSEDLVLAEQVAHLIRRLLPTGHCSIDLVASHLCLSIRTLQRRLSDEQLHFEQLVDRERRELAARYLAESRLPMNQITGLLGYAEQSALIRACRRWFGATPRMVRAAAKTPI